MYRLAMIGLIGVTGVILFGPAMADGPQHCSNRQLKAIVLDESGSKDDRVGKIRRQLACLGNDAEPGIAAAASYEVAMHLAGVVGGPADFTEAARWAGRAAELAFKSGDAELARNSRLAAARLVYYGASSLRELRRVETLVEGERVDCTTRVASEFCSDAMKLLAEIRRDIVAFAPETTLKAIETFRQFLLTDAGRKQGTERANALLDLGTLIAASGDESFSSSEIDEVQRALEEASQGFRDAGDKSRMHLANVNLGAFLVGRDRETNASLRLAEEILRPLAEDSNVDPPLRLTARENLAGLLIRKQSGNREKGEALLLGSSCCSECDMQTCVPTKRRGHGPDFTTRE